MTSNQVQVSQFFSEFTQYEDEDVQEIYTTLHNHYKVLTTKYDKRTVQIIIIHLQKYKNILIIHPTHQIKLLQKNTQMNYLHTLQITLFLKIFISRAIIIRGYVKTMMK